VIDHRPRPVWDEARRSLNKKLTEALGLAVGEAQEIEHTVDDFFFWIERI
jgi:hypothetical protein